jgi:hypothetical protein
MLGLPIWSVRAANPDKPGKRSDQRAAGHSELECHLLCLPLQRQFNSAGNQRLCRQVGWMITLDDRLDDIRREKGEPDQPAHGVFREASRFPI